MTDPTPAPRPRHVQLLNGWWDFQPVPHPDLTQPLEPAKVPRRGWKKACYLVPGFFTDHPYPAEWRHSRSAWTRTAFTVDASRMAGGARAYLLIKAAIPKAFLFVNGQLAAAQEDMFIGDEIDVTALLRPGENELAVFLTEFRTFPHPDTGKLCLIDVPWGCCIAHDQAGIWQDVQIEWRPAVHVSDVTIRTSTRRNELTVIASVTNTGDAPFEGRLECVARALSPLDVARALSPLDVARAPSPLDVARAVSPRPDETTAEFAGRAESPRHMTREITIVSSGDGYARWSPENPQLCELEIRLVAEDGSVVDVTSARFGFREVWIEGHRILLNGRPQRWYGEWCHKSHSHWLRPEYVWQWFTQLKDLNMNYVRMHTFPHPDYFFDIADEMGILICEESALHGSGQSGWDTPELWPRAEAHARRIVRRDKNHPSLVIYSVENEMRWSLNIVPGAKDKLPELRKLYNQLDPTRPAYHEGDTSLWNEDEQPILSRHYGPASHGMGWWDKKVPLHSGEMGRWHYASPYTALQWAGDEVFADYKALSQSIARDACRITELARANEVSSVFPWNTSGLDNFRTGEARTFTWDEPNSRYAKPLAHKPYESEYAWWENSSGYRPGFSFDLLRRAFRPLALVIREERNQFFNDRAVPHTVYVVNDLPGDAAGVLSVRLEQAGATLWQEDVPVSVASGCTQAVPVRIDLIALNNASGPADIVTTFRSNLGGDEVRRPIRLTRRETLGRSALRHLPPIAVVGESAALPWLHARGAPAIWLADLAQLDPAQTPVAIVAERSVQPGSAQNQHLRRFILGGGRALVLEQDHSIFPGLAVARQPIEMARARDASHPAMAGIDDDDLRFFGDDPFGLPSSDAWVTVMPYVKPRDAHLARPLVDSSGGDFGSGGLQWAPVIEASIGAGTVIASQLRLADRLDDLPVAGRFLSNALHYLADFEPGPAAGPIDLPDAAPDAAELGAGVALLSGRRPPAQPPDEMAGQIAAGRTVVVWDLAAEAQAYWEQVIGRRIDLFEPEHAVYQLVAPAAGKSALLSGISNEDTCWLENWTYTQANRKERIVDRLARIDGAVVHLCNALRSGLDVLYGDDNATEWKRMPRLSAYFDGPQPRAGGGLLEVAIGDGRVIVCQARWRPELWQFRRFAGLLLWNLGAGCGSDVLAGDSTPAAGRQSEGCPEGMRAARADEAALQEILSLGKRRAESYAANMPYRQWRGWQLVAAPGGRVQASAVAGEGSIVVGLEVQSPAPRKFMQTIGGLPNPDLQTFLRLEGDGRVRAWVNGAAWGQAALAPGTSTTISDIDFEAGSNFVVLAWEPGAPGAALALRFENKDRQPETTFAFV